MTTYRPLTEDEATQYRTYTRYAFAPQDQDPDESLESALRSVGDRRGVFVDDGDPVAVGTHHWFESHVRGNKLSTPGLSALAVPPEHRRQGHAETLLRSSLEEYRRRGDHISVLWPFAYRFYRSLGWEQSYRYVSYEVDPSVLRAAGTALDGTAHPVTEDDWHLLDGIYQAATEPYDLAFDRSEAWWRNRCFRSWRGEHHGYVWRDADDRPRGYVLYYFDGRTSDRDLVVYDLAATDPAAYHQVYRFLGDHDSQVGTVSLTEPEAAPLLDALSVRTDIETTLHGGVMVRLVDAVTALEALDYPGAADGTVVLDIADPLVDWHDDPVEVAIEDGAATVRRTGATPDVSTDIATLSAIAVGARPTQSMVDAGRISGDPTAIDRLATAFPPRRVRCFDRF